jgi:hypothetical protein
MAASQHSREFIKIIIKVIISAGDFFEGTVSHPKWM